MIFRFLTLFSVLFISACSTTPPGEGSSQSGEVSIAYLKSLCKGEHHRITEDISIRGVVVATDWLGELYKSIIVIDETSGLEIALDSRNISEHLPIYSEVSILCNGLMLARIGGKIELGAPPTGDFPLDNISDEMLSHYIRRVGFCNDLEPATKQFSDICASDISTLVRFENIRLCDEEQGVAWCDTDENGEKSTTFRTFVDSEGNTFAIRTLPSCHYATEEVPQNEITVVGVIDYSDNRYFLRIVNKWFI